MHRIKDNKIINKILEDENLGIWAIELEDGKLPRLYGNDTMLKLIEATAEMTPEECYDRWYSNVDPVFYERVDEAIKKIVDGENAEIEYPWKNSKKGWTYVRCGGVLDEAYKKGVRFSGYHQDITEKILMYEEKKWLEQLNSNIINSLENLYDGIYRVDIKTGQLMIIKRMLNMEISRKVYSIRDYMRILEGLFSPEEYKKIKSKISLESIRKLQKRGEKIKEECWRRGNNGEINWFSYNLFFDNRYPNNDFVIITVENITEKKLKEEKERELLEEAFFLANKSNLAKTTFLSRMSHDIRTPLNAILGMTRIAKGNINNKERVEECLNKLEIAGSILLDLVNQVLDMSKIENENYEEKLESVNLIEFLETIIKINRSLTNKKNIEVNLECQIKNENIRCDAISLQRILSNLISNAIKYNKENGKVDVIIRELENSNKNQYSYFEFIIQDSGIGMSQEFLEKLYEPFYRGESPEIKDIVGNGLGMSIVHSLVKRLNGNIEVESEINKGTKFILVLELEKVEKIEIEKEIKKREITDLKLKNKKILLVEDNNINCEIVQELLEMTGAKVEIAKNGREAVEKFENSRIKEYDLIFMDIQMPIMDGYEATKIIRSLSREDSKKIPIIAMSANAFKRDIQSSIEVGMNKHLTKPIEIEELVGVLEEIE